MTRSRRDSGVGWIGGIPEDWTVEPFRRHFRESKEVNGATPIGPMLSISGYRGVEEKIYESASLVRDDDQLENYRVVRPGQLAVNTMWLNYAGLGVSDLLGHMSPAYRAYWISDRLDRRYAHHLLRSSIYVQGYTALLTGIRPNSLQMSRADLMSFPVLVPPVAEQRAIADYLDRETAQIDAFIAKNEELITLLTERRASVIRGAVTGGLGPKAELVESGLDGVGPIPSHWRVMRLSWLFRTTGSGTTPPSELMLDGEAADVWWVTTGELRELTIMSTSKGISRDTLATTSALKIHPSGSLLIAMYGATIGRMGVLGVPAASNQAVCALSNPVGCSVEFVQYAMLAARERLLLAAVGGGQPNINQETVRAFRIPVPAIDEQRAIVQDLRERTGDIDRAIAVARRGVELAQERRAALISAAVTGKIDVGVAA